DYGVRGMRPLAPALGFRQELKLSQRGKPHAHVYGQRARPIGMLHGFAVQRVLKKRGRVYFLLEGWPLWVRQDARLVAPPIPRHSTHGPEARREARKIIALAKRRKINLGPWTRATLHAVAKGERPLDYCDYKRVVDYIK